MRYFSALTIVLGFTAFPGDAHACSLSLAASSNPAVYGSPVTLTANCNPAENGHVEFLDGVTVLGFSPMSNGIATFVTQQLLSGERKLSARLFSPDGTSTMAPIISEKVLTPSGSGFAPGKQLSAGEDPTWVTVADLNGDGKLDAALAVLSPNTGSFSFVEVLLGNGDGTFQPPLYFVAGTNIQSVAVGDFNGDGLPDLAAVDEGNPASYPPVPPTLNILLGQPGGLFSAPLLFPAATSGYEVVVGDFNRDGNEDVAVANYEDVYDVSVFLGNGDGTLQPRTDYATGTPNGAYGLAIGDFNGDGVPDIAVAEDNLVILTGHGDGTFTNTGTYAGGSLPTDVQTADLNNDGFADLAVANYFDATVSVYTGRGDGTFLEQRVFPAESGTAFLTIADFNGDGIRDIAAANSFDGSGGSVSILSGKGDGSFQPAVNYATGPGPYVLAQGDFTGSGAPDLVTADYGDGVTNFGDFGFLQAVPCVNVAPTAPINLDANGGTPSISITVSAAGCLWVASTTADWIHLSVTQGSGSAQITATVDRNNSNGDRTANISVAGTQIALTEAASSSLFSDVPPGSPYFDAVNVIKTRNITSGCSATEYCPDDNVTRDQMAIFLVRALYGSDDFDYSKQPYFHDVSSSTFGFAWIQKLYELGITTGCAPQLYCPTNAVSRAQMAVFLIRARYGSSTAFTSSSSPFFDDVPAGAFGFAWIQRMKTDGITSGCGATTYCPDANVTRGQMASFLARGAFNQLLPPGTPYITTVTPGTLSSGSPMAVTVTGVNTHFAQGATSVVSVGGLAVSNLTVLTPTSFTVTLSIPQNGVLQPESLYVRTGAEEAVLPAAIQVH